jgi:hypothetical protein
MIAATTHGRLIDYRNGCRCPICLEANRAYHRDYRERRRNGLQSTNLVEAQQVARHITKLLNAGMTKVAIARLADVSPGVIQRISNGQATRVWPRTASRILGVRLDAIPDEGLVPAWPTQRLMLELKRVGVPAQTIKQAMRMETNTGVRCLFGPERVHKGTARRVEVLYRLAVKQGVAPASVLRDVAS